MRFSWRAQYKRKKNQVPKYSTITTTAVDAIETITRTTRAAETARKNNRLTQCKITIYNSKLQQASQWSSRDVNRVWTSLERKYGTRRWFW